MSKCDRHPRTQDDDPKRAVGFAATAVLPGENQEEFDCLLDDLYFKYKPDDPVEEDAVETMANAIWRKRHLKIFQRAFEARMKYGAYFTFPGDPGGFNMINQETLQQLDESVILLSTQLVEYELEKTAADNTEKITKAAQFAQLEAVGTKTSDDTTSNLLPEGVFKRTFETAIAEIKAEDTSDNPINAEEVRDIVRQVAKKEIANEKAIAASGKLCSIREHNKKVWAAFCKLVAVLETVVNPDTLKESFDHLHCIHIQQLLAEFGDLLTPERYADELHLVELLDRTIERSLRPADQIAEFKSEELARQSPATRLDRTQTLASVDPIKHQGAL
jgi:hypothetical protein